MPFLFTNALFLAALAGLGIPVLIHLLLKRKSQRLRFSTVRFFAKQDEQASSKRKLRNLLLLLLRLLIFALIVLAFARPFLPMTTTTADARQRRQVIVVLDRSLSLQATDSGGIRWANAKRVTRELLASLKGDDQAALVLCADRATVASGFAPAPVVAQLLADLTPGSGVSDLSDGFREAARLVSTADPKAVPSIVVVSDLQRASAQNLSGAPLPSGIEVQVLPVGDLASPNLAVADLNLELREDALPHAVITHHGDEDADALETELLLDGKSALVKALPLKAGTSTNLDLRLPNQKPGWHTAEFRLRTKDSLVADNRRFQTFFVPEPVSVLLVEGRPKPRSFEEQTFFVAAALDPAFGTTNTSASRFAITKVSPTELVGHLGAKATRPAVVILPALSSLPGAAKAALTSFVQAGGGLLLFTGNEVTASGFNADFSGLAPVVLRAVESADEELGWRIGEHDKTSAVFAPFRQASSGNLTLPQFTRRYTVTTLGNSVVSARFEDGVPLVCGSSVGQGRVLLVNTSADTAWNDWPKHKTFVPWLQNAAQFLAGRSGEAQLRAGANLIASADDDLELGPTAKTTEFRLASPDGKSRAVTTDSQGRLDLRPDAPGFYALSDRAGREVRRFSVNVPAAEADLAALRPGEFQQQIVRAEHDASSLSAGLFGTTRSQREFWRTLLLAALGLLFVETLFANRSHA